MPEILHNILVNASSETILAALNTTEGLSSWWTSTTSGQAKPGGHIDFRFGEHVTRVCVDEAGEGVQWTVVQSNPDWDGTRLTFDLEPDGEGTLVRFGHRDWAEANRFFGHCSMKWATFLLSLRDQIERGTGRPFPHDLAI